MHQILFPLKYLTLKNAYKKKMEATYTLALLLVIAVPFIFIPGTSFFRPDGFLDKILNLSAALTGFYVAALTAAATFARDDLDAPITRGAVLRVRTEGGKRIEEPLTRREFVCMIFGYLSFSALAVSVLCAVLVGLSRVNLPWLHTAGFHIGDYLLSYFLLARTATILFMSGMVAHLAVATCLGLYYLMWRIYQKEPRITSKKKDAA